MPRLLAALLLASTWAAATHATRAALPADGLFARSNLVAWCIVPFDSAKRTPEQRADMLKSLGIQRLAYDWRNEHIPTFDREIAALAAHKIELTAWWFPASPGPEATAILDCLARHRLSPQLWITLGTEPEPDPAALERKIAGTVASLGPLCTQAARIGSTLGLYNHLGWFGEPTNQLAILSRLRAAGHTNVGIVYNFHHAHDQIDRFPALLAAMKPHLLAVNLNGMVRNGDRTGKKIIPVGSGDEELAMIQTLQDSGWRGPVGILGHTDEDAEVKLRKELAGLERTVAQLRGSAPLVPSVPSVPSTPRPINRDEPWKQTEGDWIDDRVQRTLRSRWQAYSIPTANGMVRKGLAIRVGTDQEATLCYDTGTGNWRAAWTGGFLKFQPARFGLIHAPQPDGPVLLTLGEGLGWRGGEFKWRGFTTDGERVALEYTVDGTRVRESAWAQTSDGQLILIRDLELDPAPETSPAPTRTLTLLSGTPSQWTEGSLEGTPRAGFLDGDTLRAVLIPPAPGVGILRTQTDRVDVGFNRGVKPVRARFVFHLGPADRIATTTRLLPQLGAFPDFDKTPAPTRDPCAAPIVVRGQKGPDRDAYAIDTIPVPYDNPTGSLMFCSGVGFFDNGDAAVSTIHGDVWQVSGLNDSLSEITWRRIATGLYQPLGLTVVSNQVVVLCRDHLVRLHDLNSDGTADRYESLSSLINTSGSGHDYVTSLCRDDYGNFYYVDPKGAHRISPDGQTHTTIARGFRNPNGMGVSPDGNIVLVAPQQGEWTPSSVLHELRQDGWYGFRGPQPGPERPLGYDLPLCWIPHRVDNSSGSQVWTDPDRFGPLSGRILHLSWGRCSMLLVLRDVMDGTPQGAVAPLKGRFLSGPMRGAVRPQDGQLYVVGCQGWQTAAARDGSFQRVRWTGKRLAVPTGWHAAQGALSVTFSDSLDATANDPESYSLEAWNYRYASEYGSREWSPSDPEREGHDTWTVKSASLLADGRTVVLSVPDLKPAMQFQLRFNLDMKDGPPAPGELYGTIHKVKLE
ncbi:MAG: DUF6797 domain-containing protein [Limisphaerales bacterium]